MAADLIIMVGLFIASLAFVFIFLLLKPNEVTKEKLEKILGEDVVKKIKEAKDEEEIKKIIRALPKKKRTKLKTLMESQDIRVLLDAIYKFILEDRK